MADREASQRLDSRRHVLKLAAAGLGIVATPALAHMPMPPPVERRLSFHNLHTGERLETMFWRRGSYRRAACLDIDYLLRDWRTGDVRRIDRDLFHLLHDLAHRVGAGSPIGVISGYRTAETNAMLRQTSVNVAKNSYHVRGMAIDIRLPGCGLRRLHREAVRMKRGGVGYYSASDFIHVDTGPVRYW